MKKPSDMTKKIFSDLQATELSGIAFIADEKTRTGSAVVKVDKGETLPVILAECVKEVAKAAGLSPWQVMDTIGYLLGEYQPPEDITPPLKEFADMARALYEYEHRSH